MDAPAENPSDRSVGELFHRLMEEGRDLAGSEARLWKAIALYRLDKAKWGLAAFAVAFALGLAGLVAAFVGLVLGLAKFIGPVAAGVVILAAAGAAAYALVQYGAAKLKGLAGDAGERAAVTAGELKA